MPKRAERWRATKEILVGSLIGIIEDEDDMLELLEFKLQKEGYEVVGFLNTKNVEQFLKEESVDLLIVDRNLPQIEGSEFVSSLRDSGIQTPVIFLSAKDKDSDMLEGFERGGDDYVTKPFNFKELLYRIKAVLKRTKQEDSELYQYRDIIIKPKSREVSVDGVPVELTKLEFMLLVEFVKNKNIVLTREYLLENVWGQDGFYQDRTVNVAIKRLKEKIDPERNKKYFKSVRGEGYTLC